VTRVSVLETDGLAKSFGAVTVLDGISVRLEGGRVYALCGLNGSGKSTLIKILTGVLRADRGIVRVDGRTVVAASPQGMKTAGVDVIYQDLALFPNLSVADNIVFGATRAKPFGLRRRRSDRARVRAVLDRIKVKLDLDAPVETLPISERQVVAIARALAGEARFLILDEPTASLTRQEAGRLFAVVEDLRRDGVAVLFVSHRYDEVAEIADEALVLRDGAIVARYERAEFDADRLHEAMAGSAVHALARHDAAGTSGAIVLQTAGLGRTNEFDDVDLTIRAGEIVGLTGLLGAGRTELAQTLFGYRKPDRGEIRVAGQSMSFASNRDAIAAGIAYLPEDRLSLGLVLGSSIADNIALPSRGRLTNGLGLVDQAATDALVADLVRTLGIKTDNVDNLVTTLSGGNQQRVVLAKWLATSPVLLLLDSPTVGVDVTARSAIYRIVREAAARGAGILLISDEVEEVWSVADRVHVMQAGRLGPSYSPGEVSIDRLSEIVHG
jgi:simple sugar transport system ATP-binding protein